MRKMKSVLFVATFFGLLLIAAISPSVV